MFCAALGLLAAAAWARGAGAATLTRGAYLQCSTPSSVVVRWRTLESTDTRVEWGTHAGVMTTNVNSTALTTDHEALIYGLQPRTRYWYCVGTGTQLWGDASYTFVTPPDPGTVQPVRA